MDVLLGISERTLKDLADKSVEKRKQAAAELHEIIEKFMNNNQYDVISTRIDMFSAMVDAESKQGGGTHQERDNPNRRRSGLYGLTAIAGTLYQSRKVECLAKILPPIIKALNDKDHKVQLAACDAMFNIVKTWKEATLRYRGFLEIFDNIVGLIGTTLSNEVKDYSKKVDDLLKDVVYRSLDKGLVFDLDQLIDAICAKLRACKNQDGQMVLIKWIETLHSITNVNILKCVPRFLEKLFSIVEYSQNTDKQPIKNEVAKKSLEQLGLFLEDFR